MRRVRAGPERGAGMKKILLAAAALLLALLCAACSGPMGGSVEELLEAPKLSQSQTLVMEELNRYIGGSAKLQYPRRGEFLSPFVFKDINGDGVDEAVVFYGDEGSESKNKYVRVALLAQEDGKWAVLWDEEGLGTEVEAVSFSSMYGPDTATLIVGYASANLKDKFLAVYTYKEDEHTMQKVDERSYSEYALADFTGSGTDDLVVLSSLTQPGPMEVSLLTVRDGELQPVTSLSLDSLLQDCAGIYTSLSNGQFSLVVDGNTSGGTLASEQFYFDGRTGGLASMSTKLGANIPNLSTRVGASLRSRDVDEDGAVEIPVVLGNVSAFSTEQRMQWVSFYDFAAIDEYQNNFEKEAVSPGRQIPSVLPVPTGRGDSSGLNGSSDAAGSDISGAGETKSEPQQTPGPDSQGGAPQEEAAPTNEKVFGLADLSYGYYMRLPLSWKNRVAVERLGTRNWYLADAASGATLLAVQILGPEEELVSGGVRLGDAQEYTQVAAVGRYRIFVRIRPDTGIDEAEILAGVTVLS